MGRHSKMFCLFLGLVTVSIVILEYSTYHVLVTKDSIDHLNNAIAPSLREEVLFIVVLLLPVDYMLLLPT